MPVEVGTLLSFQAGVGPGRDVAAIPCATKVMLRASYRTKHGVEQRIVDMDLNVADGVTLNYYLEPERLIHSNVVSLIAVFMDDDWRPVFFETGLLDIEHSHLTADFNRDGSIDGQDLIDFVDSHQHNTRRSDLNSDGAHTPDDLAAFVTEHAAAP